MLHFFLWSAYFLYKSLQPLIPWNLKHSLAEWHFAMVTTFTRWNPCSSCWGDKKCQLTTGQGHQIGRRISNNPSCRKDNVACQQQPYVNKATTNISSDSNVIAKGKVLKSRSNFKVMVTRSKIKVQCAWSYHKECHVKYVYLFRFKIYCQGLSYSYIGQTSRSMSQGQKLWFSVKSLATGVYSQREYTCELWKTQPHPIIRYD